MNAALAFAEASSLPIIPVTLCFDEDRQRWRKQPRVEWDLASTDRATIERWWRTWPDALPGIPLRLTDLCVVDADGAEGVAAVTGIGPLGPHSRISTPSGGVHLVFAQPDPPVTKHQWCEGVEVLGTSALLTCYDPEELAWPDAGYRTKLRAPLPEMFRKAREVGSEQIRYHRIKRSAPRRVDAEAVEVASLTAALWEMDACDWRGDYDGWFHLAVACQAVGISKTEWMRWSLTDPVYAADGRAIERIWDSAKPRHGGAFFAALAERGIRINKAAPLYPKVPNLHRPVPNLHRPSQPTRNLNNRTTSLCDWLNRQPSERALFKVGCAFAEIVSEGLLKPSQAVKLLEGNCWKLRKALGPEQFQITVARAFRHVEEKVLSE